MALAPMVNHLSLPHESLLTLISSVGAPETYRINGAIDDCPLQVKQHVDIWSLGCVYSEFAMWIVRGMVGLQEYRRRRMNESARLGEFRDGYCFHDGERILVAVNDMLNNLHKSFRACDHVTKSALKMIREMLLDAEQADYRPGAKYLYGKLNKVIQKAETKLRIPAAEAVRSRNLHMHAPLQTPSSPQTPP